MLVKDIKSYRGIANWIIYVCGNWLKPLWEAWKAVLLTANIILADESVIQVLREAGEKAQSQSRIWVYATGRGESARIFMIISPAVMGNMPRSSSRVPGRRGSFTCVPTGTRVIRTYPTPYHVVVGRT